MTIRNWSIAILTTGLLLACAEPARESLPDFELLVMEQYIIPFKNGDTEKWMQVFAEDAVGMHNTLPPFVGKSAIHQFGEIVAANLDIEQMDISVDEVRSNGNWALTRGSFASKFVPRNVTDSDDIPVARGKFILLWEKQTSGQWKVILDMGNSNEEAKPAS